MYRLGGILVLQFLLTAAADDNKAQNVVKLSKMVNIRALSYKEFHRLNAGHIIYNYFPDKKGEKDHLKTFHDLDYAGPVYIGDPWQTLNVFFDTGSADFMVLSAVSCSSILFKLFSSVCRKRRSFDETSSYKDISMRKYAWKETMTPYFKSEYGQATLSGYLIRDKVKIAGNKLGPQLIGLIENSEYSFDYSRADGIIGLGQKSLSKILNGQGITQVHPDNMAEIKEHPTMTEVLKQNSITKLAFHLFLNKKWEVGHLVLGTDGDEWRRKTDLIWVEQKREIPYWHLPLTSIKTINMANGDFGAIAISTPYSVIDPGVSLFVGPPKDIEQIHQYIFRGLHKVQKTYSDGAAKFDCRYKELLPIIAFVINDRGFLLEPHDYVKELRDSCTTGFMSMEKLTMFVIGDSFMRKFYTVFNSESAQIGLAESNAPK